MSLKQILEEEFGIEKEKAERNLTSTNLENLWKISSVLCNLEKLEREARRNGLSTVAEAVIRKYSNGHYDHNVDDLYNAYLEEKKNYQANKDVSDGESLMDAVGRLMAEIYDLVASMMVDSNSDDEKEIILNYIKKMLMI